MKTETMSVYLFRDYLDSINGEALNENQAICEINAIDSIPNCIVKIKGDLAKICCLSRHDNRVFIEFVRPLPKEEEIYCSSEITCPHCGKEDSDSWEASDSDDECYCCTCGSVFSYERDVTVSYSSQIVERNDTILLLS